MINLAALLGALDVGQRGSLYRQLQDMLRRAIGDGLLRPEQALPAERDLANDFAVSRITVRKALDALVAEGLLTRRQGAGTFVTGRVEKQLAKLSSFSEDIAARGRVVRSEWLQRSQGPVSPDEALALGLSPGSPVYRLNRIRFSDDLPMAVEHATIPGFALDGAESVRDSLYAALEQRGYRPVRALQRLRVISFTAEESSLLDVRPGAAGLLIERRGFLDDGRVIEATRSYYRGDTYDFVAELTIGAVG
ncbi:GntR family transcriptional regulator [uncultured Sphingomonas sp.]|uniref:GntR family transcriptional regulator n=1 Tax=uncultured Sphingomonas sp. TaxID=158754 RepID=UPI0025F0CCA6|nr:GntR family transcriptional regulator [uncultured Sphingomonas sp.]